MLRYISEFKDNNHKNYKMCNNWPILLLDKTISNKENKITTKSNEIISINNEILCIKTI